LAGFFFEYLCRMKKGLFIVCLLVSSLLFGQPPKAENKTDAQGKKQGYWEKIDPATKKVIYKGTFKDDKPHGLFIYYYVGTDSLRTKSEFRQDGKVAYVQMFHLVSGKIQARGKYIGEQKDSVWNFYDEKGNILSTEGYTNGKKHGVSKIFFPEGKLSEEKIYKNGVLDGPFKMYYDGKVVKAEGTYVNGNYNGPCAWYYPNGIAAAKGLYDNGNKKGVWIYKDKEGKLKDKEVWENGRQLNPKEMEEYFKKNKTAQEEKKNEPKKPVIKDSKGTKK
jgi:antitoxin component YwqK of YwqJK toxin-antitoxin module